MKVSFWVLLLFLVLKINHTLFISSVPMYHFNSSIYLLIFNFFFSCFAFVSDGEFMGKDFFTLNMKELQELEVPKAIQLTVWRAIQHYQQNTVSECFSIAFTHL